MAFASTLSVYYSKHICIFLLQKKTVICSVFVYDFTTYNANSILILNGKIGFPLFGMNA